MSTCHSSSYGTRREVIFRKGYPANEILIFLKCSAKNNVDTSTEKCILIYSISAFFLNPQNIELHL